MMNTALLIAAVGILAGPMAANAVSVYQPTPHTYQITFTGITASGNTTPSNLQQLDATLTVNFDPAFSSGLTAVTSLTFADPYQDTLFGPNFEFRYDATTLPKTMTIGDHCISGPPCIFTISDYDLIINIAFIEGSIQTNPPTFSSVFADIVFRVNGVTYRSSSSSVTVPGPGNPVPIPASAWLFGSGLLGLIGISRRKKAA